MSVNKAILIGNLGADPELNHTKSGTAVCNFNIATNEKWKDKSGQLQEKTEWHKIVVWDKQAETCSKYLTKGRTVYIEGRIETEQWDDKDGNKRYTTKIIASNVTFLGGGDEAPGGRGQSRPAPTPAAQPDPFSAQFDKSFDDDDIPF